MLLQPSPRIDRPQKKLPRARPFICQVMCWRYMDGMPASSSRTNTNRCHKSRADAASYPFDGLYVVSFASAGVVSQTGLKTLRRVKHVRAHGDLHCLIIPQTLEHSMELAPMSVVREGCPQLGRILVVKISYTNICRVIVDLTTYLRYASKSRRACRVGSHQSNECEQ